MYESGWLGITKPVDGVAHTEMSLWQSWRQESGGREPAWPGSWDSSRPVLQTSSHAGSDIGLSLSPLPRRLLMPPLVSAPFLTSSHPKYSPKAPSPNAIALRVRAQHPNLEKGHRPGATLSRWLGEKWACCRSLAGGDIIFQWALFLLFCLINLVYFKLT